jgi:hypothetical protein
MKKRSEMSSDIELETFFFVKEPDLDNGIFFTG